jgi:hypothetical protein
VAASLDVLVRGEIAELDVSVLQLAALKGVFSEVVEEQVTFVNAPVLAAERGVETSLSTDRESPDYRNLVTVRGVLPDGAPVSVSGTLTGPRQVEKLTEVDGFDLELVAERNLVFFRYHDRPGVVGLVGAPAGRGGRQHRRRAGEPHRAGRPGAHGLTVDSPPAHELLEQIAEAVGLVGAVGDAAVSRFSVVRRHAPGVHRGRQRAAPAVPARRARPRQRLPRGPRRADARAHAGAARHRATGHSEVPADPSTLRFDRLAEDVEALREHLGEERVDLLGPLRRRARRAGVRRRAPRPAALAGAGDPERPAAGRRPRRRRRDPRRARTSPGTPTPPRRSRARRRAAVAAQALVRATRPSLRPLGRADAGARRRRRPADAAAAPSSASPPAPRTSTSRAARRARAVQAPVLVVGRASATPRPASRRCTWSPAASRGRDGGAAAPGTSRGWTSRRRSAPPCSGLPE